MTTVGRQGEIIQIHDNRITRLTENVSKTKYWKSVKKVLLNVTQKAQNSQILFTSQESAQECWKCKIVLQIRKSAQCLLSPALYNHRFQYQQLPHEQIVVCLWFECFFLH